ncbi:hypothetical protein [Wenyingzhuangia sp. 2_MG-2023]|nr:hypothetical protein [Wenyingzhuangia sp. 2_MG-2023]MDO6739142.1 hypothetical protein [Wenyingzhuangia sp. 2_MG-2023]
MKLGTKPTLFKFNKRRDVVFFIFVIATFIFWFLNKLSKEYTQDIYCNISYTELPNKFVFQEDPPEQLAFLVRANGFYLFNAAFKNKDLTVSLKKIKRKDKFRYYLLGNELKRQAHEKFNDRIAILDVLKDTLFVTLGKKSFKKVPIKPDVNLDYHSGYKSFSDYVIQPDSIEVSGPEMQIAKIKHIKLKPFHKEDVMSSIEEELEILKADIPKVSYSETKVKLSVLVEKITEKTILVPVKIINTPASEVVIYPKKIKLSCQVKLSDFHKITAKDFTIVCDYKKRKDNYMEAELTERPTEVTAVKIARNKVEYLILK